MTRQPNHENRHPDEIESDIEQTRSRLDDTLNQLERKISPQQWMNDTYDYVRHGGANEFATNLGETIKQNPVPVMLAGVGLGWLMLSSSQRNRHHAAPHYDHDQDYLRHDSMEPDYRTTAHSPGLSTNPTNTGTPGTPAVSTAGAGTTSSGTDPMPVGTPTDRTGRQSNGQGRMSATKDKARHMATSARGRSASAKDSSRAAMSQLSHKAQGAGAEASHFVQEHPLVAGALGIALGAALGGLLPSTRTEDEYLGETRDKALDKAATAGQQQADKAQAKMEEKGEQAKSSASAQRTGVGDSTSHATTSSASASPDHTPSPGTSGTMSQTDSPGKPPIYGADNPSTRPRSDDSPTRGG